jgi:hypothetical protein
VRAALDPISASSRRLGMCSLGDAVGSGAGSVEDPSGELAIDLVRPVVGPRATGGGVHELQREVCGVPERSWTSPAWAVRRTE